MANLALRPMRYSYSEGLYSTGVNNSTPEGPSLTFYDGAPVIVTAGAVLECGANPIRIDGVAIGNSYNDTLGRTRPFTMPDEGMIYEVSIDQASSQGSAAAVLAQTDVGTTIGITKDVIGGSPVGTPLYWYIDVDKKLANQRMLIIGFPIWSPAGTVNGRVFAKWLSATSIA